MKFEVLNKKRNIFYQIAFFIGLVLIVWEIFIFRRTVVPLGLLLFIILVVGSLATFFDFKKYSSTYDLKGWKLYFFAFIQNTFSWGFITCSILILSNYYFSKSEIMDRKYEIVEKSSLTGSKGSRSKRKPLVVIKYEERMKELVFPNKYYKELEHYKYVNLSTKKGFIHWDIIVKQELVK